MRIIRRYFVSHKKEKIGEYSLRLLEMDHLREDLLTLKLLYDWIQFWPIDSAVKAAEFLVIQ